MCIIIGKYFPGTGWTAVKNRDRNYIPEISFRNFKTDGLEVTYFWDDITQYCEGINSAGVGILSASLMVLDDEKEIDKRSREPSRDGIRIKAALKLRDPRAAAMYLIKQGLTGNTLVFDAETMILIEGAYHDGPDSFEYRARIVPHTETVVRTNHGIMLPWAGYQRRRDDTAESASRVSSESRLLLGEYLADRAHNPMELIDSLCRDYVGDPQLNVFRTTDEDKKMRTTAQLLIIPREETMYVRPVQSHMTFDFWKLNQPNQKTWVEILSNRPFYRGREATVANPKFMHTVDNQD